MCIVTAEHIYKSVRNGHNELEILKDINITFPKGKLSTLMGPSGAGKSTLLNIIGLIDVQTKGKLILDGMDVSTFTENQLSDFRRKHIGFIFQAFNLIQPLTVEENIQIPLILDNKKVKKYNDQIDELLEKVGLKDKKKQGVYKLSGGEQQRVAIVRALINEPKLIVADEPTGNLDSKNSIEIIELLKALTKQGTSIVLVTHDPFIEGYSDFKVRLIDGKINERYEEEDECAVNN